MLEPNTNSRNAVRVIVTGGAVLCREALAAALNREAGISATAVDPEAGLSFSAGQGAVILLLGGGTGNREESANRLLRERAPLCLVVCGPLPRQEALELLRWQVGGIFDQNLPLADLSGAIRAIAGGGKWLGEPYLGLLVDAVAGEARRQSLSIRELEVLEQVVNGLSNKEIGKKLSISETSVKTALQRLFRKAGVRTRSQLVRAALESRDWMD